MSRHGIHTILKSCILVPLLISYLSSPSQLIGTVAGTGYNATSGDQGPATCAGLPLSAGVCIDPAGNMYITSLHRVRKVDAVTGIITTIAGSEIAGYGGDGGPAINAQLNLPLGICLDVSGNLYISEYGGARVRKIDAQSGIISTIAGTGTPGFSGDGGPATSAMLRTPYGLNTDNNGNLYVSDYANFRIRKINLSTGVISTVAGNGSAVSTGDGGPAAAASLGSPAAVCTDAAGNIYLTEYRQNDDARVRKIHATTGIITTIAGGPGFGYSGDGGPALNATFRTLLGICSDGQGNIYVSDHGNNRIRKIIASTGFIQTLAGNGIAGYGGDNGPANAATLYGPIGLCADNSGNIFVGDHSNNRIRKIYVNLTSPPPPPVTNPGISISSSSTSPCNGPITFTATATNAGQQPIFQWFVNGFNVGSNATTFVSSNLADGDLVWCMLTAQGCTGVMAITSNTITITGNVTPAVTISASATTICSGANVTFTASTQNAGTNPGYQWKKNGMNTGTNSATYSSTTLLNGDVLNCLITVDPTLTCITSPTAFSNSVAISVTNTLAPTIQIASTGAACPGETLTFTATAQNEGSGASFQWKLNGSPVGSGATTFSSAVLSSNDRVTCTLTPGNNGCSSAPVHSDTITVQLKPVPAIAIVPVDTIVIPGAQVLLRTSVNGSISSYSWTPSDGLVNALTLSPVTKPIQALSTYRLQVINNEGCAADQSITIRVPGKLLMPDAFTPNGDGRNDVFRIPVGVVIELETFEIYDRWGKKVFTTRDPSEGWDGRSGGKKLSGVFVYMVRGTSDGEIVNLKGTVIVLR